MSLELISLTPLQALGIPIALVGSGFLAAGAEFQHRGVVKVGAGETSGSGVRLGIRHLLALMRRPSWLLGTIMLGLAIVFQLFSLYLAPLTVVQPLGAIALVITALRNAQVTKTRLDAPSIRAIAFCVGGVGLFVTIAAFTTASLPLDDRQLLIVLIVLVAVLAAFAIGFAFLRRRLTMIFYVVAAAILFGFVATLAKVVIDRVHTLFRYGFHPMPGDWLTIVCVVGLAAAAIVGSYFVQTAYSYGSPDVVVAGLTVIDPIVGVTIGIAVLHEADSAPLWAAAVFVIAGLIAVYGVLELARHRGGDIP